MPGGVISYSSSSSMWKDGLDNGRAVSLDLEGLRDAESLDVLWCRLLRGSDGEVGNECHPGTLTAGMDVTRGASPVGLIISRSKLDGNGGTGGAFAGTTAGAAAGEIAGARKKAGRSPGSSFWYGGGGGTQLSASLS